MAGDSALGAIRVPGRESQEGEEMADERVEFGGGRIFKPDEIEIRKICVHLRQVGPRRGNEARERENNMWSLKWQGSQLRGPQLHWRGVTQK